MPTQWQSFKVKGDELLAKVREIVHEGNVRRVVIKQGPRTVAEFPLTIGVVGALAAPMLVALGALAAVLAECTIDVERETTPPAPTRKVVRKRSR